MQAATCIVLCCCLVIGLTRRADAETIVSGTIAASTWTESGSSYHVTGDLTVPAGVTLTVEPGAVITLDGGVGMTVHGTLLAVGTSDKVITIEATNPAAHWAGILLTGDGASGRLEYLNVGHGSRAEGVATSFAGGISNEGGSRLHIQNCRFHDFMAPCIENNTGGELTILDTLIEDTMEAIHSNTSFADIERCHIRNIHGYSDCIDLDNDSTPFSIIKDCILENGEDDGLDLSSTNAIVSNITIRNMSCKAISLDSLNGASSPNLSWIAIMDCVDGVVSKSSCTPIIRHVTVSRCEVAINFYEKEVGYGGGHGTLDSFIVWGNKTSIMLDALSTISITFSDIEGGYVGTGNENVDPLFVDAAVNDFRLRPGSPVAGRGKDGEDMGAYPVATEERTLLRGDCDGDGIVSGVVTDAIFLLNFNFLGGTRPGCFAACDANADGQVSGVVTDAVYLLGFNFLGGPPPPAPFPGCGPGTDVDGSLGCETPSAACGG